MTSHHPPERVSQQVLQCALGPAGHVPPQILHLRTTEAGPNGGRQRSESVQPAAMRAHPSCPTVSHATLLRHSPINKLAPISSAHHLLKIVHVQEVVLARGHERDGNLHGPLAVTCTLRPGMRRTQGSPCWGMAALRMSTQLNPAQPSTAHSSRAATQTQPNTRLEDGRRHMLPCEQHVHDPRRKVEWEVGREAGDQPGGGLREETAMAAVPWQHMIPRAMWGAVA